MKNSADLHSELKNINASSLSGWEFLASQLTAAKVDDERSVEMTVPHQGCMDS